MADAIIRFGLHLLQIFLHGLGGCGHNLDICLFYSRWALSSVGESCHADANSEIDIHGQETFAYNDACPANSSRRQQRSGDAGEGGDECEGNLRRGSLRAFVTSWLLHA